MMGNSEEARDVVQETFILAYQALPKYVPQGYFHAWLHKIATNQCLRRLRSRKKMVAWEDVDPLMTDPNQGPEDSLLSDEKRQVIREAMKRLPDDYRVVVALRYDSGLSYNEIAEALGVPITTIETRLFRAKEKLRRMLEPSFK
jgi:RNA polymerase sigma-70 factor (ECF subfamily)